MKKESPSLGDIRILSKNLGVVEWNGKKWVKTSEKFPNTEAVINLFKAHNNFNLLIDDKSPEFLKGWVARSGGVKDGGGLKVRGARINVLPDGVVLDKFYSIFSPDLKIHDESSHSHWDVIFRNPGGAYSYLYAKDKKENSVKNKFSKVRTFDRMHESLFQNVENGLQDNKDLMSLPMYTLLKTYMRVGNEIYFRTHGHKGLATLKKEDISFLDGGAVGFDYIGKDGVPLSIREVFPGVYINRLKSHLKPLRKDDFVFTKRNKPLKDTDFMEAFIDYCGIRFYPHIVRSHYATKRVKDFLRSRKKASKSEVDELFLSIARKLGHRHFSRKKNEWVDNFDVTIHYYVDPVVLKKVRSRIK